METIALNIKFLLFLALQLPVVALFAAVLIGGVRQIVKDKVRTDRRADELLPTTTG